MPKAKTLANEERLEATQYKRLSKEELEKFFGKAKELTQHFDKCPERSMEGKMKIYSNKIKCNFCGDVIESKHRHDFETCKCGRVSVDGGHDYLRRCFKEEGDYEELSEYEEEENDE